MVCGEQVFFGGPADYYNGSLVPFSVDQTTDLMEQQCCYEDTILAAGGYSEAQMSAICTATESTQTDAPVDDFSCIPLMTEPLINCFDLKNHDSSTESAVLKFYRPEECSGNGGIDNVLLDHWTPKEQIQLSGTYMNMDWQEDKGAFFPVQAVNTNNTLEYQSYVKEEADTCHTSNLSPNSMRNLSRKTKERSRENDSRRRFIFNQRVKALKELLPPTMKNKRNVQESVVQDAIDHIKCLQLQLKELSRSRLGGESCSGSLKFVEGYGHFQLGEMLDEPLEELIGRLFEENPTTGREIFEKKGLFLLSMASVASLCDKG